MTDREYEKACVEAALRPADNGGQLSINGEFQLEAFKLLLVKLKEEEQKLLLSPEFDYGVDDESA